MYSLSGNTILISNQVLESKAMLPKTFLANKAIWSSFTKALCLAMLMQFQELNIFF